MRRLGRLRRTHSDFGWRRALDASWKNVKGGFVLMGVVVSDGNAVVIFRCGVEEYIHIGERWALGLLN